MSDLSIAPEISPEQQTFSNEFEPSDKSVEQADPDNSKMTDEIKVALSQGTKPENILSSIVGKKVQSGLTKIGSVFSRSSRQDNFPPQSVEGNEALSSSIESNKQEVISENEIKSEALPDSEVTDPEVEIVKEAKETLNETITLLNEWREIEVDTGEKHQEPSVEQAYTLLQSAKNRLRHTKTLRFDHVKYSGDLSDVIEKARAEITDKKELLGASQQIKDLEQEILDKSKILTGVNDIHELTDLKISWDAEFMENASDSQKELVMEVLQPYINKVFGENDPRFNINNFDNVRQLWRERIITKTNEDSFNILQEVIRRAGEAGDEELKEAAQNDMKSEVAGYVRSLPSIAKWEEQEIVKYDQELDEIGRQELVAAFYYLSKAIDLKEPGNHIAESSVQSISADIDELGLIFDYSLEYPKNFFQKLITEKLDTPLERQPEYLLKALAEKLKTFPSGAFARIFPENYQEALSKSAEILSSEPRTKELMKETIKEHKILSSNEFLTQALQENNFNIQRLIWKLRSLENPEPTTAKFEKILKNNDESALIWEYYRLEGEEQERRFFSMTPADYLPYFGTGIPGLPENLQWGNMRTANKARFSEVRDFDNDSKIRVDHLTPEGRAILLKSIVKSVVEHSQNTDYKRQAEERNRAISEKGKAQLHAGDLLHGTNINYLNAILHGGDRAGEFLGFDEKYDATPTGADFSMVLPEDESGEFIYRESVSLNADRLKEAYKENPFYAIYSASIAAQYGAREEGGFTSQDADSTANTGVTLIFGRDRDDAFLKGMEYRGHMREHHVLIPVGLPSTEVTGLIVNEKALNTLDQAKTSVIEHGFYVPIYGIKGELLFTYDDYIKMKENKFTDEAIESKEAVVV